jgi:hypothetical protein
MRFETCCLAMHVLLSLGTMWHVAATRRCPAQWPLIDILRYVRLLAIQLTSCPKP